MIFGEVVDSDYLHHVIFKSTSRTGHPPFRQFEPLTEKYIMKTQLQRILNLSPFLTLILFFSIPSNAIANDITTEDCTEEEVAFSLYCPPTLHLNCKEELWNLNHLENAYYHDYTGYHDAGKPTVKYYLNDCNIGYIIRTWRVEDYNWVWHTCSQKIYVGGNSFNHNSIVWPQNIQLTGCNPPTKPEQLPNGKDKPRWNDYGASCSKIGVNYHDNVFVYGPGCYEIIRTWTLMDCCVFNPYTNTGVWSYNQRITVTTTSSDPKVWVPNDAYAETYNCKKVEVIIPELEVKDGCEDQYLITNDSPYAYKNGADASGKYPVGTTKVRFMVKYNCWETKFYTINVTVNDKSTPVPICYYGLSIALMGVDTDGDGSFDDGMAEVWASDLDKGSYHPCRPYDDLKISFSSDPHDNVRIFTCEDVGKQEVNIWVTDKYGRQDYCTTYIKVQNNAANIPNCQPISEALISGNISSLYNNTEELTLQVNSTFEGMNFDTSFVIEEQFSVIDSTVDENGQVTFHYGIAEVLIPEVDTIHYNKDFELDVKEGEYMLEGLDLHEDYTLQLINKDTDLKFIDSNDVLILQAYLDGVLTFNMYQKIAADLNHDMMIDEKDLQLLTDFVNGQISADDLDLSWTTFDPDFEMSTSEQSDIMPYPTSKTVEIKNRSASGVDLMIFQMGDLGDEQLVSDLKYSENVSERSLSQFNLKSVAPNPFRNETTFTIEVNNAQFITLQLFDLSGKMISQLSRELTKGVNALTIERATLNNAGIYFYKINAQDKSLQGKLILIE